MSLPPRQPGNRIPSFQPPQKLTSPHTDQMLEGDQSFAQHPLATESRTEILANTRTATFEGQNSMINAQIATVTYNSPSPNTASSNASPIVPCQTIAPSNTRPTTTRQARLMISERSEHSSRAYTRLMSRRYRGYALYQPEPISCLPAQYKEVGVSIGDVGIVTSEGAFDFLFNIYLPSDHAINRGRVPPTFSPLFPFRSPAENIESSSYWQPGDVELAGSVHQRPGTLVDNGELSFEGEASEGAILALPHGGSRHNLLSTNDVFKHICEHAEEWYKHIKNPLASGGLGRDVANGSLYVITGVDKTRCWGTGAFSGVTGEGTFNVKFRETAVQGSPSAFSHTWDPSSLAQLKSGPLRDHSDPNRLAENLENQAIFLRGFKITFSEWAWFSMFPKTSFEITSETHLDSKQDRVTAIKMPSPSLFARIFGSGSSANQQTDCDLAATEVLTSISPIEPPMESVHPSEMINSHLLNQDPHARIAVTHDDVWCSAISENGGDFYSSEDLLKHIFRKYDITHTDDAIHFQERPPSVGDDPGSPSDADGDCTAISMDWVLVPPVEDNLSAAGPTLTPTVSKRQSPLLGLTSPQSQATQPTQMLDARFSWEVIDTGRTDRSSRVNDLDSRCSADFVDWISDSPATDSATTLHRDSPSKSVFSQHQTSISRSPQSNPFEDRGIGLSSSTPFPPPLSPSLNNLLGSGSGEDSSPERSPQIQYNLWAPLGIVRTNQFRHRFTSSSTGWGCSLEMPARDMAPPCSYTHISLGVAENDNHWHSPSGLEPLLQPPKLAPSAWQLYFTDWIQKHRASGTRKLNIARAAKEAAQEYTHLTNEQKEPYKQKSQSMKGARESELASYRREIAFRQRREGQSRKTNIKDLNAETARTSDHKCRAQISSRATDIPTGRPSACTACGGPYDPANSPSDSRNFTYSQISSLDTPSTSGYTSYLDECDWGKSHYCNHRPRSDPERLDHLLSHASALDPSEPPPDRYRWEGCTCGSEVERGDVLSIPQHVIIHTPWYSLCTRCAGSDFSHCQDRGHQPEAGEWSFLEGLNDKDEEDSESDFVIVSLLEGEEDTEGQADQDGSTQERLEGAADDRGQAAEDQQLTDDQKPTEQSKDDRI